MDLPLIDTNCSEHGARLKAMDNISNDFGQLGVTLQENKGKGN